MTAWEQAGGQLQVPMPGFLCKLPPLPLGHGSPDKQPAGALGALKQVTRADGPPGSLWKKESNEVVFLNPQDSVATVFTALSPGRHLLTAQHLLR